MHTNNKKKLKKKVKIKKDTQEDLIEDSQEKPIEIIKKNIEDIDGKFIHVKVGDHQYPATEDMIKDVREDIETLFKNNGVDNCVVYVSHHAIRIDVIR